MLRFPKRARAKSIDLEESDLVEFARSSVPDADDLVDTDVRAPKPRLPGTPSSIAPVAMNAGELTFRIPRAELRAKSPPFHVEGRPSLPWAAALIAFGAIAATVSGRLLDSVNPPHPPASAAVSAPPPPAFATPLSRPKPAPVVLTFSAADEVTLALDAPKPSGPAAPPTGLTAAAVPSAKKAAPVPAPAAAPPESAKKSVDSLATQQLKAALK